MNPTLGAVLAKGKVVFHYIKSNYFRVIYATGVQGGISPKGDIEIAFFNERNPLPERIAHSLTKPSGLPTDDVMLGPEIAAERVSKEGVVREVEVQIVMNRATAQAVHQWLGQHLAPGGNTTTT